MNIYSHQNQFLDNKYTRWYYAIIIAAQSQNRKKNNGVYYENHHIIPRSMNGENISNNLVFLSAREHFLVHWLLTKMCVCTNNKKKMIFAIRKMMSISNTHKRITNSWQYEIIRKLNSSHSEETKLKMRKPKPNKENYKGMIGKHSEETKLKMRKPKSTTENMKKPKSENFKILAKKRRWYNNGITHVFQENCPVGYIVGSLSNSTKGHILTDEHRKKLGQQSKNRKWYNNGEIEKFSKNEILGWKLGRLLKN